MADKSQIRDLKLELASERKKNWEARQEITRLKKKAKFEKKYSSLKTDF